MLSLPMRYFVGDSCARKVRRIVAAALVGFVVLSGCSSGSSEARPPRGFVSGSPSAESERPTPMVPEYTFGEGLEVSADDIQLADEAVIFFTEYMATANRAYKDGGEYWDKYIDMSAADLKEANENARDELEASGFRAINDLKYQTPRVLDFGLDEDGVFLAACLDYQNWERVSNDGPYRPEGVDDHPEMGFYLIKADGVWKASELYKESPSCDTE